MTQRPLQSKCKLESKSKGEIVAPCIHAVVFNQDGNVNENKNGKQK